MYRYVNFPIPDIRMHDVSMRTPDWKKRINSFPPDQDLTLIEDGDSVVDDQRQVIIHKL